MSELSLPPAGLPSADSGQWPEQMQDSIQAFLKWIDSVEIQSNRTTQGSRGESRSGRRNTGFTNGPYAEIKESIGRFLSPKGA